ncbi:WecB/TagA/CpsF family glycosyltransferase [Calothrix parietina]|uniref:WecB/TagA/CpsF family glycosyltransferase n=3 Tax=Calotrichaceae TaxID=2661849 RepID=A0ABR8A9L8_9CYAN|nr:WecB/TagA/CpsF family glycosyltransferase [Calothrix parietina FACHB-288]MBD2224218.1 WecB/TagA/CpsF family glycosyltransferase [Calothrix anomala FACHB-343]
MTMIQENVALKQHYILGMKVNVINYKDATRQVIKFAKARKSSYVFLANVHMVMEAYDSAEFRQIVNAADIVTPDGKPLSWSLQALGATNQQQVCGRELTLQILKAAALSRISVGFYGSSKNVLSALVTKMKQNYPDINIAYAYSPPFRSLTPQEKDDVIQEIKSTGVQILFVGLGCPKQERWIAQHKNQIPAVMLGIGGAFDMLAGAKPQVPCWMQNIGLEWLFRLCLEPRRLWYRNFRHSPRFIVMFARQILKLILILALLPAPAF